MRAPRPRCARTSALLLVVGLVAAACSASSGETTSAPDGATVPDDPTSEASSTSSRSSTSTAADTSTTDMVPVDQPPVYVLVLDELPLVNLLTDEGDLNATRFPNLADLAERSTWYTNWTVHSGRTIHSVPALLSGVLPHNALATPDEYPSNLVDALAVGGWRVHALEHNSWLCREELCPGRLPYPTPEHRQAGEVLDDYIAGMDDLPDGAQPTFHLLHLVTPHPPWTRLPDGTTTGPVEGVVGSRWPSTPWMSTAVADVESRWQLGDADRALGRWVAAIEARGDWDDALVVVTADHGEDLQPGHNSRDVRADNQRELVWVPTFVKLPGQRDGRVDDAPRTASELAGMVRAAVGLPAVDGVGEHHRVVVTDVWPYEDGAPLTFAPVDESARPVVTGRVSEGPGWDGLVDAARRGVLPDPVVDLVGRRVPTGAGRPPAIGRAGIDHLDVVAGAERGTCGWDLTVSGDVGPRDRTRPYVALGVQGVIVGVAPVEAIWPGAATIVEDRPSYFRILLDPDDVPVLADLSLHAVDGDGELASTYTLAPSAHAGELECPV